MIFNDNETNYAKEIPRQINYYYGTVIQGNVSKSQIISGNNNSITYYNKYRDMIADKDLIIGNIANDRIFFVIDNFFVGNITDAALVNSLSALQLGKQYVAVSQKGCDAVRIEAEVNLSYLERLFMKDVAEENRARGISLANDICRNYRREGMFFDEILDEVKIRGKE